MQYHSCRFGSTPDLHDTETLLGAQVVRSGGWAAADAGALVPLIEGELDQLLHPLPHESVRQSSGLPPVSARAQVRCSMSRMVSVSGPKLART